MKDVIHPNVANLMLAAKALGPLTKEVVFVGGATAALYVNPALRADARSTVDVDCVVEISSRVRYQHLEERMRTLGFHNDTREDAPICRWLKGDLVVDLMPTDEKILGFANSWYAQGLANAEECELPNGQQIAIFPFEYFVASKCEALLSRGLKDLALSQDLEDLLFVMNGREDFAGDLKSWSSSVQGFAANTFGKIYAHANFENAVRGNMPRSTSVERQNKILSFFRH